MNTTDFTTWAPVAAAGASAIAAAAAWRNVYLQNKNALRTRALDLLHKKETQFETGKMLRARSITARALLADRHDSVIPTEADDVLNFMETVGMLVVDGDLPADLAWTYFYGWFVPYFYALRPVIEAEQRKDESVWAELVALHTLLEREQLRRGRRQSFGSTAALSKFLEEEARMVPPADPNFAG